MLTSRHSFIKFACAMLAIIITILLLFSSCGEAKLMKQLKHHMDMHMYDAKTDTK